MKTPTMFHAAGWIALAALLGLSPQLAGCDTSAPSQKDRHEQTSSTQAPVAPKDSTTNEDAPDPKVAKSASDKPEKHSAGDDQTKDSRSDESKPQAEGTAPRVKRLIIASRIEEREPVELDGARVKDPVTAFMELSHQGKDDSGVVVTFVHEGGDEVGFVELEVPADSPRYRTWARTSNISQAGTWTAVVRTKSGQELARKSFIVTG